MICFFFPCFKPFNPVITCSRRIPTVIIGTSTPSFSMIGIRSTTTGTLIPRPHWKKGTGNSRSTCPSHNRIPSTTHHQPSDWIRQQVGLCLQPTRVLNPPKKAPSIQRPKTSRRTSWHVAFPLSLCEMYYLVFYLFKK